MLGVGRQTAACARETQTSFLLATTGLKLWRGSPFGLPIAHTYALSDWPAKLFHSSVL